MSSTTAGSCSRLALRILPTIRTSSSATWDSAPPDRQPGDERNSRGANAVTIPNERVAYFNGRIVPGGEATIWVRDRGFKYGDAAVDATRTFGGKPFRLEQHVDRLYRSLRYLQIDPGLTPKEMIGISEQVLEKNRPLLG